MNPYDGSNFSTIPASRKPPFVAALGLSGPLDPELDDGAIAEEDEDMDERLDAEKCPIGGISVEKNEELLLLLPPALLPVVEKFENELDWWKWLLLLDVDPNMDDDDGGDPRVVPR